MNKLLFKELNLSSEIQQAVSDMGFEEATPIQSLSIPVLMEGKDVVGQAHTGTGKTAAFGIPMLEKIDPANKLPQSIVLCPTRELAIQVAEEMTSLSKYKKGIKILPVYGGQPIDRQITGLKRGVQIVIGTPGRVLDHLRRKTLKLGSIQQLVLDEADEMLDMGFRDDIELIIQSIPVNRQTIFFSATMPRDFIELTKKYQKNPEHIKVVHGKFSIPDIQQIYYEVKEDDKLDVLSRIIDMNNLKLSLVFCNTKRKVDDVVSHLQVRGYSADAIHGDMNQSKRDRVMKSFRNGRIEILVATDVAARGIDVESIEAVFNYDFPQDEEYYVHRIGRTGRAGKSGYAFTLTSGRDMYKLKNIQKYGKINLERRTVPSLKDVQERRISQYFEKVKNVLLTEDITKYTNMVEHIMGDHHTSLEVCGALIKMALNQQPSSGKEDDKGEKESKSCGKTTRLFINVGKKQGVKPGDIVGAIAGETGISGRSIGQIELYDNFSFVEVPEDEADRVITTMKKKLIRGKQINVEKANKK
ncbi:MAG: DEAD/DEAH box helicase [Elusimicrobiota bacterium]